MISRDEMLKEMAGLLAPELEQFSAAVEKGCSSMAMFSNDFNVYDGTYTVTIKTEKDPKQAAKMMAIVLNNCFGYKVAKSTPVKDSKKGEISITIAF